MKKILISTIIVLFVLVCTTINIFAAEYYYTGNYTTPPSDDNHEHIIVQAYDSNELLQYYCFGFKEYVEVMHTTNPRNGSDQFMFNKTEKNTVVSYKWNSSDRRWEYYTTYNSSVTLDYVGIIYKSLTIAEDHPHDMQWKTIIQPTCTEAGEKHKFCSKCNYYTDSETIPASGHDYINGYCSLCNLHKHSYEWKITKEATCSTTGLKEYKCKYCGRVNGSSFIDKTEHKNTEEIIIAEPTCTTKGSFIVVCTDCKLELGSWTSGLAEHNYIDCVCTVCGDTNHNFQYVVIYEPTCENYGAEQMQCICGSTGATRTIPKLQHNYVFGECTNCGGREGQNTNIPGFPQVDVTKFSFVLDDLNKDTEFNATMYPETSSEYTLNVFQVAESSSEQLFLYVYNPITNGVKLDASYINMSTEIYESKNPTYKFYSLTKLSESGQFTKYLVNNFKVKKTTTRYYNIVGIYTPYNADIHSPSNSSDDIKNYVGVPVAKCFEAITKSGTVTYACKSIDYVDAEIIETGTVRYADGSFINHANSTDSHFVAFNVNNFDVKKIFDIDIRYMSNSHEDIYDIYKGHSVNEGAPTEVFITVYDWQKGENEGGGFLGSSFMSYHYKWDRITTLAEFKKDIEDAANEDLIGFNKSDLSGAQFVIRFLETNYTLFSADGYSKTTSTRVTKTTILRMHFATPEDVYNLGVVADVVSDDGKPDFIVTPGDNVQNTVEDFIEKFFGDDYDTLETILAIFFIVALIIVIILLVTYFKSHSLSNAYEDVLKALKGKKHKSSRKRYRKNRRSYGKKSYNRKKGRYYVQKQKGKTRVQTRYKKRT